MSSKYGPRLVIVHRGLTRFFGFLVAFAGIALYCFESSFSEYPGVPEASSGRVVAYTVKYSVTKYVTPHEAMMGHATHYVLYVSAVLFVLFGIFELLKKRSSTKQS
jgi:hypothetical protein